jgi:hypothetical protein
VPIDHLQAWIVEVLPEVLFPHKNRVAADCKGIITMEYNTKSSKYQSVPDVESLADDLVKPSPTSKPRFRKRGRSCLTWCLIIMAIMVALFMLVITITVAMAYGWMRHEVIRFTVSEPLDLPIHELPPLELEGVKFRAKVFFETLKAGQVPADDLTLSVGEFNGFIAHSDFLRGNAYASISENEVSVDLSLPVDYLPGGNGRYFTANWYVGVSQPLKDKTLITTKLETYSPVKDIDGPLLFGEFLAYWQITNDQENDQELVVNLQSGQFLKWIAPKEFIDEKDNLLEDICDNDDCTEADRIMEGIRGISIDRNGDIVIQAERSAGAGDNLIMPEDVEALKSAVDTNEQETTTTSMMHGGARRLLMKALL